MTVFASAIAWRKSSYSAEQTNCVEVAPGRAWLVRDTKNRDGGQLTVPFPAWRAFLSQVRER
jgi:hypothetical protein